MLVAQSERIRIVRGLRSLAIFYIRRTHEGFFVAVEPLFVAPRVFFRHQLAAMLAFLHVAWRFARPFSRLHGEVLCISGGRLMVRIFC